MNQDKKNLIDQTYKAVREATMELCHAFSDPDNALKKKVVSAQAAYDDALKAATDPPPVKLQNDDFSLSDVATRVVIDVCEAYSPLVSDAFTRNDGKLLKEWLRGIEMKQEYEVLELSSFLAMQLTRRATMGNFPDVEIGPDIKSVSFLASVLAIALDRVAVQDRRLSLATISSRALVLSAYEVAREAHAVRRFKDDQAVFDNDIQKARRADDLADEAFRSLIELTMVRLPIARAAGGEGDPNHVATNLTTEDLHLTSDVREIVRRVWQTRQDLVGCRRAYDDTQWGEKDLERYLNNLVFNKPQDVEGLASFLANMLSDNEGNRVRLAVVLGTELARFAMTESDKTKAAV
jgi:hypothetical protein